MSSFAIYMIGAVILIFGLGYLALTFGAPPVYIAIGALIILGITIMSGVRKTRERDDTPTSD